MGGKEYGAFLLESRLNTRNKVFQESNEENILFCGHCHQLLGTLNEIIAEDLPANHICFTNVDNVIVDYSTKTIIGKSKTSFLNSANSGVGSLASSSVPASPLKNIHAHGSSSQTQIPDVSWTDSQIHLLITMFIKHQDKFDSPLYNKKKVWDIIGDELKKHGVNKTGTKCDEKWRNLKKVYDKVLSENKKTGNSPITWKFFNNFHDIYFKDPRFQPVATASGEGVFKRRAENDLSSDDTNHGSNSTPSKKFSPGEKSRKAISALELDKRRQKRHEERMVLKKEMFNWFKENYKPRKGATSSSDDEN